MNPCIIKHFKTLHPEAFSYRTGSLQHLNSNSFVLRNKSYKIIYTVVAGKVDLVTNDLHVNLYNLLKTAFTINTKVFKYRRHYLKKKRSENLFMQKNKLDYFLIMAIYYIILQVISRIA
jgi:hypothetical protein